MKDPYERERFEYRAMLGRRAMTKFRNRLAALAELPWNRIQKVGEPPCFSEKPPADWDWESYYKNETLALHRNNHA